MRVIDPQKQKSLTSIARVHISYGLDFGGCETQMVNLATEYELRGLKGKVVFCSLTKGGISERRIMDLGFEVFCLELKIWEKPLTALIKLSRFLRQYEIPMLVTTGSEANLFGSLAGRFAHAQLIVTEEIGVRSNTRKQRFFIRFAYKIANFNFAVSKLARENLLRQRLVDPMKCIVSYAPLNLVRREYKTIDFGGNFVLLYLGRIHPEKDFNLMLSSLSQIRQAGQSNFRLMIVGARNFEEHQFLEESVKSLDLASKVSIHGATGQPNEYIDKCHFLVQSSLSEGMGFSVLEAICRNKPIVSTNVGIVPEIIVNGSHGFVSKTHEVNSFAAALSQALSIDEVKYTKMVENVSRIDLSFVATPKYIDLLDSLEGETNK
jgi:glycosyltransferase involved in cell wall biosynthesis